MVDLDLLTCDFNDVVNAILPVVSVDKIIYDHS